MRDPKLVETLKTLKKAQASLGKVIEQLESLTALSLQSRDISTARRLAGQWVKEEKEGIDPSKDPLDDSPESWSEAIASNRRKWLTPEGE